MIPFEEAYDILMTSAHVLDTETIDLCDAMGRVLAEDVCSDLDMPPFNKSAMDGYACRREDLDKPLAVLETVKAGCCPTKPVGPGECSKIMTGAMVPEGANCVIMVEYTESISKATIRFTGKTTRNNICCKAEDIKVGDVVLQKGDLLKPQHIAVLASVGCVDPVVFCRPTVGVISTGDELVEPEEKPAPSQIRNSNSMQLCTQVISAGAEVKYYGIARDTEQALERTMKMAFSENDVVLLSGGVSMGDYDFVPVIMKRNNIKILFNSVAMKPGKPSTFGTSPEVYCIALPGNPVSTFVQFELMVRPFLYKLMGHEYRRANIKLPLAETISRKSTSRQSFIPVIITPDSRVKSCSYHGSAHVNALCKADGLISIPVGVTTLEEGESVSVRQI